MKLDGMTRRLAALEKNKSTPEADADGRIHMETFETHYLDRLKEFGCSNVVEESSSSNRWS